MRIGDVDLLKHDTMKNQRTPRGSGDQRASPGGSCGYAKPTLGAHKHCREMQIGDVDL